MLVTVVNKYTHAPTEHDVYIGRGSVFGNPYTHLPSSRKDAIKVKTRAEACAQYQKHFMAQTAVIARKELLQLINKVINNEPVNLVCFCSPKQCHGDYLKQVIDEAAIAFTSSPARLAEFRKAYEIYCMSDSSD